MRVSGCRSVREYHANCEEVGGELAPDDSPSPLAPPPECMRTEEEEMSQDIRGMLRVHKTFYLTGILVAVAVLSTCK